ncbi:MAG: hypothetical protein CMJ58_11800 [Planctomycetaceae bacterium]|nr:hypothetical protein [Planctomycetaceae bacterium]
MYQALRRAIRSSPLCHQVMRHFIERYHRLGVRPDTQVVLEGYQRCSNSFATVAFMHAQTEPVSIAHHLHSVAQIKLGVRRGLPTLVLIREPRGATLSFTIRRELPSVVWALEEYLDFYRGVEPLADRVVIADFTETTADMGAVTRRLNERFGTHFGEFDHTEENVEAVYRELEQIEQDASGETEVRETHVARPSEARQALKEKLAAQFEQSPARELYAEASALYAQLRQQSAPQSPAPSPSH